MRIDAPQQAIWDVLVDFESYPSWARDIKETRVVATDADGRPAEVLYRAAAMGRSTTYTLRYDWSSAPDRLGWSLAEGDIMRALDGAYEFRADGDATDVTYHLSVDLKIPLPAFVKRRAEARIVSTALRSLRSHVTR